jgi:hypothetical protein
MVIRSVLILAVRFYSSGDFLSDLGPAVVLVLSDVACQMNRSARMSVAASPTCRLR